jgi:L-seryl-tRNA(Ser) seleniumtransferase
MMTNEAQARLRQLPSVDGVLQEPQIRGWSETYGRELVTETVRTTLEAARQEILEGAEPPSIEGLVSRVARLLQGIVTPTLRPVINATGVIIHTNLGRAPLSESTMAAMERIAKGYSNLEFELEAGRRGSRYDHAESVLCRLTGAEAALLVNNNAAAVLLALIAFAQGREVLISRGQLVEIGGGFRIPEVMAQSGARLVEVGTTNRTYVADYAGAITEKTAMLLRVHTSNYRVEGFTYQPPLADLVALGREQGLYVMHDLGSGSLLDTAPYGLAHEPTVQESVEAGMDLVTFSGDKLLGGPQAGIIVGKGPLVEQLKHHPLARALRMDKIAIAGVQANLLHYLKNEALEQIPVWRMIATSEDAIKTRAEALTGRLRQIDLAAETAEGASTVGGGSLPGETLPTTLVALHVASPEAFARGLRLGDPPVIGRIDQGRLLLDPRTILPEQEDTLCQRVGQVASKVEETYG